MMSRQYWREIIIFLIGLAVRGIRPGAYFLWIDELNTLNASADIAYQGVWTWVGNPANWDGLAYHSPLSNYVMTLPFLISTNPIVGRLLIAVLGALTAVVMMRLVTRYVDNSAGLMAGLLLAVFPQMVEWGRFVWNPNLAPLVIVLWVFTLLLGYHEGKRKYQIWHWIWLSMCFQAQSALLMLVPVTLLTTLIWHRKHHRPSDFAFTGVSLIILIITCIPWGIGLRQYAHIDDDSTGLIFQVPTLESFWGQVAPIVGSVDFKFHRFDEVRGSYSGLPNQLSTWIQHGYVLCIVAGMVMMWRKNRVISWVWLGVFLLPFSLAFIVRPNGIDPHYLMPSVIMGIVLASVALHRLIQNYRKVGLLVFVVIWAGLLWITVAHLAWVAWMGTSQYSVLTHMDTMHEQVEAWHEQAPIVFLQDEPLVLDGTFIPRLEWVMFWKLYEKMDWVRLIDAGNSIPISPEGQFLVGFEDNPILTHHFPDSQIIRLDMRTHITWQYTYVHPDSLTSPQIQAQDGTSFYGLMNIDGITLTDDAVILQWQGFQTSPVETYWFELSWDNQQQVILSLPSYQWRFGETVLTTIPADIGDADTLSLSLRRQSDDGYVTVGAPDSEQTQIMFIVDTP